MARQLLRAFECLLVAVGVVALGWSGFVRAEAGRTQRRALTVLARARATAVRTPALISTRPPEASVPTPPHRGDAIAELDIPRLRMSQAVLEGADDSTLRRGPGHIEETSIPGEPGNIGIAGHRD